MLLRSGKVAHGEKKRSFGLTWDSTVNSPTTKRPKSDNTFFAVPFFENEKDEAEELHLLQTFPSEIWMKIADNLQIKSTHSNGINNLQNLSNSSPYFRKLLSSRRSQFMFAKVLTILKKSNIGEALGSDLLKWRLVCTSWNKRILEYYLLHPTRTHLLSTPESPPLCDDLTTVTFSSVANLVAFWNLLVHVSDREWERYNPFPFGFLQIILTEDSQYLLSPDTPAGIDRCYTFWRKMLHFILFIVSKFGQHVMYCKIVLPLSCAVLSPTLTIFYQIIVRWLEYMVNLKTLEISYTPPSTFFSQAAEREEYHSLLEEVEENPMPTLPQLQCLKTSHVPSLIFNEIVRANSHVRRLHVVGVESSYILGRKGNDGGQVEELQIKIM